MDILFKGGPIWSFNTTKLPPNKCNSPLIGPSQLAIHVVQNRHAGEQKSHWDKTNNIVPMSLLLSREAVFYHVNEEPIHHLHILFTPPPQQFA